MAAVAFYFDCSSPWTYLAFENILRLARELSFVIEWKPILVGGVFNAVNPSVYAGRDNPVPAKAAYTRKDLADWAAAADLRITWPPSVFPVNSVRAMRGCLVAAEQGRVVPHARAAFEAYWRDDRDISEDAVLADVCAAAGLDPDTYFARLAHPDIKAALRANTDELIARGGFGSPTMFVGADDMYFGNDRLPLVRRAIAAAG